MAWGQLRYNACPRCRGTMCHDHDRFGAYLECLQCGHIIDLDASGIATGPDLLAKLEKRTRIRLPGWKKDAVGTS